MGPARRRCGTVVSSRLYLAVYRIVALSAVSGTNFRFELRPGQQAASLYALLVGLRNQAQALLERLETREASKASVVSCVGQIGSAHEQCLSRPSDFRDIHSRTECSQAQLLVTEA